MTIGEREVSLGQHVTIDDVARAAGVSKGTVSNVINGRVVVSPRTREKVDAAITALGFRPAETARALTSRKRLADSDARPPDGVPRLTIIGYVSVDYFACLDRLPMREERRVASAIVKSIGGPAANVAAVAAGLGHPVPVATSLITTIGIDQESDWAAAELANRRVDLIVPRDRREGRLTRAIVMVEADGRRTIINEPSNLADVDVQRFIDTTDPAGSPWCLHVEGYQLPQQMALVPLARERGFRTSMQATGLPQDWLAAHADAVFDAFDVVVLHRESLGVLPGCPAEPEAGIRHLAAEARHRAQWPALLAVTLGARGALLLTRSGEITAVPALPVEVVDTTGAGDSFVGALLAAWLNGWPACDAGRLACAAGSLQVTRFGAQELRPAATDLMAHLGDALSPAVHAEMPGSSDHVATAIHLS